MDIETDRSFPPVLEIPPTEQPVPFRGEYSKIKLIALFALFVPIFLVWTALSLAAFLPLKIANALDLKWNWGNSLAEECFDLWIASVRYFFSPDKVTPGNGRPILLVHGYLHNSSGWYNAIDELKKAGCGPIYTIDLGDGSLSGKFLSLRDYAKQVGEKIREIKEETGNGTVALVGHSMGGVVSCLYATEYAEPDTVTDVVTIGSPMRGSFLADWLAEGANGYEMMTDSPLLEEILRGVNETPRVRFYSVASKTDEIVPFKSALHGNDPLKQMIVEDKGHLSLMTSRKVAQTVASWLKFQ